MALKCPECESKTKVVDTREDWRMRVCLNPECRHKFKTQEVAFKNINELSGFVSFKDFLDFEGTSPTEISRLLGVNRSTAMRLIANPHDCVVRSHKNIYSAYRRVGG